MMKIVLMVPVIVSAMAMAGCATTAPPMVVECSTAFAATRGGPALTGVPYGTQMSPIPLDSVQFDSDETARRIAIQGIYASRTPGDTVAVEVRMVSCNAGMTTVRARTSFQRANGAPAEPASAWRVIVLPPRALTLYTELSTARDVHHYVVELSREL
jgi:hypothetical protein